MSEIRANITAVGMYVPEKRVTNDDLSQVLDTSDKWIRERTGISERRIAGDDEANSDLSVRAIRNALEGTPHRPEDIDLIIVTTVTPDMMFPSTACRDPGEDRGHEGVGFRSFRGLLRLPVRPLDGCPIHSDGNPQESPGGGHRRDEFHYRFRRPGDLRSLR